MIPHRIFTRLVIASGLVLACLPAPAHAQKGGGNGDITAALESRPAASAIARPEHHELKAGDISATVTVLRSDRPFPAGGSVFAQIKLENAGKKGFGGAELVLTPRTAVIRDISGDGIKVREEGGARVASVEKIARRKPRTVIVELKLRDGESANALDVTLRRPGEAGETASLHWDVANCAGGFYSEIVKLRQGPGAGIADALKAARSRDKARPGRWLFPPRYKASGSKRKCVTSTRRWDKRRGRFIYRCAEYEAAEPETTESIPAPFKSEREVFRFAARTVSSRAVDRELAPTRDSGWATQRVSQNLQYFLGQDRNPAICTGTLAVLDYFEARMAGFVKRAEQFEDMNAKAKALARLRFSEAVTVAKALPGGHPGWGSAPLDPPRATDGKPLKARLEILSGLTGDTALADKVSRAENGIAALRVLSAYFGSTAAKSLEAPMRSALYRALSASEAADYIGTVASHYDGLSRALIGSMSSIREAHVSHCTCGG